MTESTPAESTSTPEPGAAVDRTRISDGATIRTNALGPEASLEDRRRAALAGGVRPRRFGWWYACETFLHSMRAYGWTLVVGGIGSPLIYLLGLGLGLAAVIPVSVADGAAGPVSYVTFVAPALAVTAAVSVGMEEFTYPVMAGFKWRKTFFGIAASPLATRDIPAGLVLAVAMRMAFVTGAYYLITVAFGAVDRPLLGALSVLTGVLAGLAFGLPLLAYSASLREDRGQMALIQRFVFTPLFLFSGTFYPLETLPAALQPVGWLSPVWHGAELGRFLTYGAPSAAWLVVVHLAVLALYAALGAVLAVRTFTRRLA